MKIAQEPSFGREDWFYLAMGCFPEWKQASYNPTDKFQMIPICENRADFADCAHRSPGVEELLSKCYLLIRWSIWRVDDAQLLGWIADGFFSFQIPKPVACARSLILIAPC